MKPFFAGAQFFGQIQTGGSVTDGSKTSHFLGQKHCLQFKTSTPKICKKIGLAHKMCFKIYKSFGFVWWIKPTESWHIVGQGHVIFMAQFHIRAHATLASRW